MDFPEFSMKNVRSLHMYESSTATFYNTLQNEDKKSREVLCILTSSYWPFLRLYTGRSDPRGKINNALSIVRIVHQEWKETVLL